MARVDEAQFRRSRAARFFDCKDDATQYVLRNPTHLNPKIDGGRWVLATGCAWNTFSNVRNQGLERTCFAFSVISVIESLYKIIYGEDITVDWEDLLSRYPCDYSNGGCSEVCLRQIMTQGVRLISHDVRITIDGFVKIPNFNEEYLLVAVAYQPVIACLKVGRRFQKWKGCGVYEGEDDALENDSYVWHSIVIIGYGEENGQKYFEIQNTWGEGWGNKGRMKVARGLSDERGVNGLYMCPMYPVLYKGWTIFDHRMHSYGNFYNRERCKRERCGIDIPCQEKNICVPRCGVCPPYQERKNHVPCPLVGKGKKQLYSNISELKKVYAEEMHGSINANYAAFMSTSKEILDLVGELSSIGNMLSTLAALIHGLGREPSELEKWLVEFPDLLDVLC